MDYGNIVRVVRPVRTAPGDTQIEISDLHPPIPQVVGCGYVWSCDDTNELPQLVNIQPGPDLGASGP
jgi:hypothetical protein